ncbi:DUF6796 family protein [Nocardia sp. NPDC003963]
MTNGTSLRSLRLTGVAGIFGAVLWTLGDILLIGANAPSTDYPLILETYAADVDTDKAATMLPSSAIRLAAGALVANVGIIFYLAGSWHLFRGLQPSGRRWAIPVLVMLLAGFAWAPLGHAGYYYLGMVYKTITVTPADAHPALLDLATQYHYVLQIAWYLPIVTIGAALLALAVIVALDRTAWPRWFALIINPISLITIGTVIAVLLPEPIGTWLSGAAFNLGLLLVFLLSTALLRNGTGAIHPVK